MKSKAFWMDTVGIKIKFQLAAIKEVFPKAKKLFNADILNDLGDQINKEMRGGKSPVEGYGRFTEYSDSYKTAIKRTKKGIRGSDGTLHTDKRIRPVNLFVSGAMQRSQRVKEIEGKVNVSYSSPLAAFHNIGTLKMPRRPMLPTDNGDKFSRTITKWLYDRAKRSIAFLIGQTKW